jgi:hypothetical protein
MSDTEKGIDLGPLDPAGEDPAYWDRFQEQTLARAWPLLERRALQRTPRLGLQLVSWGRMVAPAAALAAAFAGLMLVSETPELEVASGTMTEIEEILNQELHRAGLPAHYAAGSKVGIDAFVLAIEDVDGGEW